MTKDGGSVRVNGVKDKTMEISKEKVGRLVDTLRYTLSAVHALNHAGDLQETGKKIPDVVKRMSNELFATVPELVALELAYWAKELRDYRLSTSDTIMMRYWLGRVSEDDDEDEDDE
jgi:hypothetical protein